MAEQRYVRDDELIARAIERTRLAALEANRPTGTEINQTVVKVQDALDRAEEAFTEALKATHTADGKNAIYVAMTAPTEDPERPFAQGDLWYVTNAAGRFVNVRIWNGSEWAGYQFVADSVLVPGSVGGTVIADGAIATQHLVATAIDGMTVTGATVRTSSSGNRTQMDTIGLRTFYGGVETARLTADTGGLRVGMVSGGIVQLSAQSDRAEVYVTGGLSSAKGIATLQAGTVASALSLWSRYATTGEVLQSSIISQGNVLSILGHAVINLEATSVRVNGVDLRSADSINSGTFNAARIPAATESARGGVERATQTEVNTGTDTTRYVTPATLRNSARIPFNMEAGTVSKRVVAAGAQTSIDITFPTTVAFTKVPVVTATAWAGPRDVTVQIDNVTTTGFTVRLSSLSVVDRTMGAHWMAVQMAA